MEDALGHEGTDRRLQGGHRVRTDRRGAHAVDDHLDRDITLVLLPPSRQEGEPVDADDVAARDDDEPIGAFQHPEGSIVTTGPARGLFQRGRRNINDRVARAQTQGTNDGFDAGFAHFTPAVRRHEARDDVEVL